MSTYFNFRLLRQIIISIAAILVFSGLCHSEDILSNRIFSLSHKDAQTIIDLINQMELAESVNKVRNVNAVVVTATSDNLVKAAALVGLVDSKTSHSVRFLKDLDPADIEDARQDITAKVKNISLGTFEIAPIGEKKVKVIGFEKVKPLIKMVKSKASYAANPKNQKIPKSFKNFLVENIDEINTQKDFEAFMLHFEAVVGFSYGEGISNN